MTARTSKISTAAYRPDDIATMRHMFRKGHTSGDISKAMFVVGVSVSASQIRSWASRNGWQKSSNHPNPCAKANEVREQLAAKKLGWPVLRYGNADGAHEARDRAFVRALVTQARELGIMRMTA